MGALLHGKVSTASVGILCCLAAAALLSAQSSAWQAVGPAPPAVITPVVVGPSGSGVIYIATFGGGVLKSTDEGRSFILTNNGLTNLTAPEAIEQLLTAQIQLRNDRRLQAAMRSSRLPVVKQLHDFDFTFQPSPPA